MQTIVELPEFLRKSDKLLKQTEKRDLINYLASHPEAGDIMRGTGGIRKLRWAAQGRGKRSGIRIIYYYHNISIPLFLLTVFGKMETQMSKAFDSIKQGLDEALEFSKGQKNTAVVHKYTPLDVKNIRAKVGMSQTEFASAFGISVSTLRHWERGDRTPNGPALVLLNVVAKEPKAVLKALTP